MTGRRSSCRPRSRGDSCFITILCQLGNPTKHGITVTICLVIARLILAPVAFIPPGPATRRPILSILRREAKVALLLAHPKLVLVEADDGFAEFLVHEGLANEEAGDVFTRFPLEGKVLRAYSGCVGQGFADKR